MRKTAMAIGLAVTMSVMVAAGGISPASASTVQPVLSHDATSLNGQAIVATALTYLGFPYKAAGASPATGFDDVGFVQYVYASQGITLPSSLKQMVKDGIRVTKKDLQPGDLVFFRNTVFPGISHVGIYIGNHRFVHAEWYNSGVTVSSFRHDPTDGNYWVTHYKTAIQPQT